MNKFFTFLLIMMTAVFCRAKESVVVIDSGDKSPIVGASVISSNGIIKGITDSDGKIDVDVRDFPLYIRCIGYDPVTVNSQSDSVFMKSASYALSEVVVTPHERPITRVLAFSREYCTGTTPTDTMQMYCEYMLEYFFAEGKVKGYKKSDKRAKILCAKRYGRIVNSAGLDSIMRPRQYDAITYLSAVSNIELIPDGEIEETEALMAGATTDTIQGKYYPNSIYRKNNNLFIVDCDRLSNYKDHKLSPWLFKLVGLTMEMQMAECKFVYNLNESGKYNLRDFIYGTCNMHMLGKGKLLRKIVGAKDDIAMDNYIEQYPVEIEYLTVEEYKDLKNGQADRSVDFVMPANTQPLPPSIQNLLDRIDRELPQPPL